MFDEMERLRESGELYGLLSRYAALGAGDRQAWQDRVREMPGVGGKELVRLHGELLAYGWVEQNAAVTSAPRPGEAPGCYRVTPAGRRVLKQAQAPDRDAA